jgi:hypothetical protein
MAGAACVGFGGARRTEQNKGGRSTQAICGPPTSPRPPLDPALRSLTNTPSMGDYFQGGQAGTKLFQLVSDILLGLSHMHGIGMVHK